MKELLNRHIPQILGSYFVAGTSLVLFVEYLVDKYQFPIHYPALALFGIIRYNECSDLQAKFEKYGMRV